MQASKLNERTFTTNDALAITGVSSADLKLWRRTDLFKAGEKTDGFRVHYSVLEVIQLYALSVMIMQRVRSEDASKGAEIFIKRASKVVRALLKDPDLEIDGSYVVFGSYGHDATARPRLVIGRDQFVDIVYKPGKAAIVIPIETCASEAVQKIRKYSNAES